MIIEIHGQKADNLRYILDFVLRISHQRILVDNNLSQIDVKIILIGLQRLQLILRSLEDTHTIIIANPSLLENRHIPPHIHSIHTHPLIKPGFGYSKLLL